MSQPCEHRTPGLDDLDVDAHQLTGSHGDRHRRPAPMGDRHGRRRDHASAATDPHVLAERERRAAYDATDEPGADHA